MKGEQGFTLIELIVTATFSAIAFLAIVSLFIGINNLNRLARNLTQATQIAQNKIETYRNAAFSDIPIGSPAVTFTGELPNNLKAPRSAVINVTLVEPGLKRVDVLITYTDGRATKKAELSTMITEIGLNH